MHARIDHLLSLRDGEPVDAAVRSHVESCSQCAEARRALETIRRRKPNRTRRTDARPSNRP